MTASNQPAPSRPRLGIGTVMIGFGLGMTLTVVGILVVLAWWNRDATPNLTQDVLAAARRRWKTEGPASYDVDLKLTGRQQADIHVEVRDGKVTAMTYNGQPPKRKATWAAWSVNGQFGMISTELKKAEESDPKDKGERKKTFGVADRSQIVLRADFDPRFGYPRKYYRVVLDPERKTSDREISWEVTRFKPIGVSGNK